MDLFQQYNYQQSKINNFQGWIYFLGIDSFDLPSIGCDLLD
jgi:hypothetical protein